MRKMTAAWLALCLLVIPETPAAPPRVGDVTGSSRRLDRALLDLFARFALDSRTKVEVLFLVDPSPALVKARFADRLLSRIDEMGTERRRVRIGLAQVGARETLRVEPTLQHRHLEVKLHRMMGEAAERVHNVYADIRKVTDAFSGGRVRRVLVLVSLANGYLEDDLEATVRLLKKERVTFHAITGEAFLADTYFGQRRWDRFKGCTGHGGDGPFVDLPSGWLWQEVANESIPSGVGMYALSRLAGATGGRVWLHGTATAARHRCSERSRCPFCSSDHLPRGRAYSTPSVRVHSPLSLPRAEAVDRWQRDPLAGALLRAWHRAWLAGLVGRRPPAVLAKGMDLEEGERRALLDRPPPRELGRQAQRAKAMIEEAAAIAEALAAARARHGSKSDLRIRAVADLALLNLRLARTNLHAFVEWVAGEAQVQLDPTWMPDPPERRFLPMPLPGRIWTTTRSVPLCHGTAPLLQLGLVGGRAQKKRLAAFGRHFDAFVQAYRGTPYAAAAWRLGMTYFELYCESGGASGKPRRPPRSSKPGGPATPKHGRPGRPGSRPDPGPGTGGGR